MSDSDYTSRWNGFDSPRIFSSLKSHISIPRVINCPITVWRLQRRKSEVIPGRGTIIRLRLCKLSSREKMISIKKPSVHHRLDCEKKRKNFSFWCVINEESMTVDWRGAKRRTRYRKPVNRTENTKNVPIKNSYTAGLSGVWRSTEQLRGWKGNSFFITSSLETYKCDMVGRHAYRRESCRIHFTDRDTLTKITNAAFVGPGHQRRRSTQCFVSWCV